ncbi:MAG TPA: NADH-quinone oxidoreductase subunit M [Acidobacteriota bacterium]|nr:NADH-quinone oxidoreductase subunit M [Acidobacteriota bacterium]
MEIRNILSLVTYLPAAAAILLLLVPRRAENAIRRCALLASLATFVLSLYLAYHFDAANGGMQYVENVPWIRTATYRVGHHLGIDGISLFLVILTTFLTPLAILSSWQSITKRLKPYMISLLVLETGMIGVFCALDLVLFYVFWEVMLIPMYFLIGIWGGTNRIYAAVKFILYTMAGSLLMLLAIIYLFFVSGGTTFDLVEITQFLASGSLQLSRREEFWLFMAFLVAFAIKVPLFPFHTWLPDAHVEAPTAGSVILAGVLLKMGTYGLLRFCLPLFPGAALAAAPSLSILALIGIIYGALVAMVQPDLKKLVAYSSVSHMGLVVLGIFAFTTQGLAGSTVQMLNHGLSTGALFLLVGMIYDRRHTRMISDFGGLAHASPVLASMFLVVTLSSIGLPGLNGFVGEILVLAGTFMQNRTYAAIAALGMILGAVYMLWMYQRVFLGKVTNPENAQMKDIGLRERLILLPILAAMLWIGVYSAPFLRRMDASLQVVQQRVLHARGPEGGFRVEQLRAFPGREGSR